MSRTNLIELTRNTWADPAAITIIRFAAAPLNSKDVPPCPDGMKLEVYIDGAWVTVTWFDGSNPRAFAAASDRMEELTQRVNAAKRPAGE